MVNIGRASTAFVVKCFNYLREGGCETPTFEVGNTRGVPKTHCAAVETDWDQLKLAVYPVRGADPPLVVGVGPLLDDVTVNAQDFLEHNDFILGQK